MTTTVAIAAQYASGNPTSRPSNIEIVAASAVRKACDSDGRFSLFQVQSFMEEIIFAADVPWQGHNLLSPKRERPATPRWQRKILRLRNSDRLAGASRFRP